MAWKLVPFVVVPSTLIQYILRIDGRVFAPIWVVEVIVGRTNNEAALGTTSALLAESAAFHGEVFIEGADGSIIDGFGLCRWEGEG